MTNASPSLLPAHAPPRSSNLNGKFSIISARNDNDDREIFRCVCVEAPRGRNTPKFARVFKTAVYWKKRNGILYFQILKKFVYLRTFQIFLEYYRFSVPWKALVTHIVGGKLSSESRDTEALGGKRKEWRVKIPHLRDVSQKKQKNPLD